MSAPIGQAARGNLRQAKAEEFSNWKLRGTLREGDRREVQLRSTPSPIQTADGSRQGTTGTGDGQGPRGQQLESGGLDLHAGQSGSSGGKIRRDCRTQSHE